MGTGLISRPPYKLTIALGIVMTAQSGLGIVFAREYRDVEWVRAAWFGNDWVTLVVVAPLLVVSVAGARTGSVRASLLWMGLTGYAFYNYAFYLFGAALNAFFPIYVAGVVLAASVLILAASHIEPHRIAANVRRAAPIRFIGGSLLFIAAGLSTAWIAVWAAYAFAGRPTPVEPEAFKLVAALDLSLMVPALSVGGVLIWKRMPWGFVVAALASIQGALYLLVLCVNSVVVIRRGIVSSPGEVPIWAPVTIFTTIVALLVLTSIQPERETFRIEFSRERRWTARNLTSRRSRGLPRALESARHVRRLSHRSSVHDRRTRT